MAEAGEPGFKQMLAQSAQAVQQARDARPAQVSLPLTVVGDHRDDEALETAQKLPGARGRPPGARNKTTEDMTAYIRARYTDPRIALAEIYSRDLGALIAELKAVALEHGLKMPTDVLEILKVQKSAAEALMPYMASKQPIAVQVDSKGVVTVNVIAGDIGTGDRDGEIGGPVTVIEGDRAIDVTPKENQ